MREALKTSKRTSFGEKLVQASEKSLLSFEEKIVQAYESRSSYL